MKIFLTIIFSSVVLVCQSQNAVRDLEKYMEDIKKQPYLSLPKSILEDRKSENKQLKLLKNYVNDSIAIIRSRSYYLVKVIGVRSEDASIRQDAVITLVEGIADKDTGISGSNSEALKSFEKKDFTNDAKVKLAGLLKPGTAHLHQVIRMIGFLELKDQQSKLTEMLTSKVSANDKWACHLALARMGEGASLNFVMDKVKSTPVDDKLVYGIVPDLTFTKQKAVFDYLVTIINMDIPSCQSANPDSNQKILCGYRVMELIADDIKEFPVAVDAYGDLKVKDYEKALEEVRQWFKTHPDYELITAAY